MFSLFSSFKVWWEPWGAARPLRSATLLTPHLGHHGTSHLLLTLSISSFTATKHVRVIFRTVYKSALTHLRTIVNFLGSSPNWSCHFGSLWIWNRHLSVHYIVILTQRTWTHHFYYPHSFQLHVLSLTLVYTPVVLILTPKQTSTSGFSSTCSSLWQTSPSTEPPVWPHLKLFPVPLLFFSAVPCVPHLQPSVASCLSKSTS